MLWKKLSTQKQNQHKSPNKYPPISPSKIENTKSKLIQKNNSLESEKNIQVPKFGKNESELINEPKYQKNLKELEGNKKQQSERGENQSSWTLGGSQFTSFKNINKEKIQQSDKQIANMSSSSEYSSKIKTKQSFNNDWMVEQIPEQDYEGHQNHPSPPQNPKKSLFYIHHDEQSIQMKKIAKKEQIDSYLKQSPSISSFGTPSEGNLNSFNCSFKPKSLGNLNRISRKSSKQQKIEMDPSELQSRLERQFPSYYQQKYSSKQQNRDFNEQNLIFQNSQVARKRIPNNFDSMKELPFEDFLRQMQQVGLDIADLDSKSYDSPIDKMAQNSKKQFKLQSSSSESVFAHALDFEQLQRNHQKIKQNSPSPQFKKFQMTQKVAQVTEKQKNSHTLYVDEQLERTTSSKTKITKVKTTYIQIKNMKNQIEELNQLLMNQSLWMNKAIFNFQGEFTKISKKIFLSENLPMANTIEQQKHQIKLLQQRLSQKQSQNLKQVYEIEQLKSQIQEISLKMNEQYLKLQQQKNNQIKKIAQNYSNLMNTYQNSQQYKKQSEQQINRLNEEVEQLTRLCEQSQQQYKKSMQSQKLSIFLQKQKQAKKQASLNEKQNEFISKLEQLKQAQQKLFQFQCQLQKKQDKIRGMEERLKEKLAKVQRLQQQVSEGFNYIEETKKQYATIGQKLQQQRDFLIREKQILQIKAKSINIQSKQANQEIKMFKQRSLPLERVANDSIINMNQFEKNKGFEIQEYYFPNSSAIQSMTDRYDLNQNAKYTQSTFKGKRSQLLYEKQQMKTTMGTSQQGNRYSNIYPFQDDVTYKNNTRYMSQVVEPSYRAPAFTSLTKKQTFQHQHRYSQLQGNSSGRSRSPKLSSIIKRTKSSSKLASDFKLSELDTKISQLRNQIQKQIGAARKC